MNGITDLGLLWFILAIMFIVVSIAITMILCKMTRSSGRSTSPVAIPSPVMSDQSEELKKVHSMNLSLGALNHDAFLTEIALDYCLLPREFLGQSVDIKSIRACEYLPNPTRLELAERQSFLLVSAKASIEVFMETLADCRRSIDPHRKEQLQVIQVMERTSECSAARMEELLSILPSAPLSVVYNVVAAGVYQICAMIAFSAESTMNGAKELHQLTAQPTQEFSCLRGLKGATAEMIYSASSKWKSALPVATDSFAPISLTLSSPVDTFKGGQPTWQLKHGCAALADLVARRFALRWGPQIISCTRALASERRYTPAQEHLLCMNTTKYLLSSMCHRIFVAGELPPPTPSPPRASVPVAATAVFDVLADRFMTLIVQPPLGKLHDPESVQLVDTVTLQVINPGNPLKPIDDWRPVHLIVKVKNSLCECRWLLARIVTMNTLPSNSSVDHPKLIIEHVLYGLSTGTLLEHNCDMSIHQLQQLREKSRLYLSPIVHSLRNTVNCILSPSMQLMATELCESFDSLLAFMDEVQELLYGDSLPWLRTTNIRSLQVFRARAVSQIVKLLLVTLGKSAFPASNEYTTYLQQLQTTGDTSPRQSNEAAAALPISFNYIGILDEPQSIKLEFMGRSDLEWDSSALLAFALHCTYLFKTYAFPLNEKQWTWDDVFATTPIVQDGVTTQWLTGVMAIFWVAQAIVKDISFAYDLQVQLLGLNSAGDFADIVVRRIMSFVVQHYSECSCQPALMGVAPPDGLPANAVTSLLHVSPWISRGFLHCKAQAPDHSLFNNDNTIKFDEVGLLKRCAIITPQGAIYSNDRCSDAYKYRRGTAEDAQMLQMQLTPKEESDAICEYFYHPPAYRGPQVTTTSSIVLDTNDSSRVEPGLANHRPPPLLEATLSI